MNRGTAFAVDSVIEMKMFPLSRGEHQWRLLVDLDPDRPGMAWALMLLWLGLGSMSFLFLT